ncbi:MAG: alpha/beta hydrolase-fold protein [Myxococcota bacterium]
MKNPRSTRVGPLRRRDLLSLLVAAGGLTSRAAAAPTPPYTIEFVKVAGDATLGTWFCLLKPRAVTERVPVLVAFHGLGETHDQQVGIRAWVERYGLERAYARLSQPPLAVDKTSRYWRAGRLEELNAKLAARPFAGVAICCPFTPNVHRLARRQPRDKLLTRYSRWVLGEVLPAARKRVGVPPLAERTHITGCSLGGYVAMEVFLRNYEAFGAFSSVQGALGRHRVDGYAERLAEKKQALGPRPILLETSSQDAFVDLNRRLSQQLKKRSVEHDWLMPPGPHNQPFLRESGTLEMLLWHERVASRG